MKLRHFLQTAACCSMMLAVSQAGAADGTYSLDNQRLYELEQRLQTLELGESNTISLAGYACGDAACGDTACGDACGSCGADAGCGCDCGGYDSCWTNPGCYSQFDAEIVFLAAADSEADQGDGQDSFNPGLRLTYSRINDSGKVFRIRYFNFGTTLSTGMNRYEFETLDTEIGRRFTLGGDIDCEFTAGIRYAAFDERNGHNYDTTFGPLLGLHVRGREFLRGTSFVNLRHSWQFGETDGNNPNTTGTFNVSELQFGLEWERENCIGAWVVRAAIEAQYWAGVQEADTEDIGLYGIATSVGLAY